MLSRNTAASKAAASSSGVLPRRLASPIRKRPHRPCPRKAATAPYAGAQGRSLKRGGIAGGGCNWMTARQARRGRGTLPPNQLRRGGTLTFRQCYAASLIHIRGSPLREASEL